jgi:hypothetical protein
MPVAGKRRDRRASFVGVRLGSLDAGWLILICRAAAAGVISKLYDQQAE